MPAHFPSAHQPYPTRTTVVAQLAFAANANPDGTAVETLNGSSVSDGPDRVLYSQLLSRAASCAQALRGCRGCVVGLCVGKSFEEVLGVVAAAAAGAAWTPLPPELPLPRLLYAAERAHVSVVCVTAAHTAVAASLGRRTIHLDAPTELAVFAPHCCPGDAAHVLFTSGSTGALTLTVLALTLTVLALTLTMLALMLTMLARTLTTRTLTLTVLALTLTAPLSLDHRSAGAPKGVVTLHSSLAAAVFCKDCYSQASASDRVLHSVSR